ncbi:MAG: AAA family ATPase [Caldilineaceae bacterium]
MECYATSVDHILAELERIDLLIQLQVGRARQLQTADEPFQGLYIPEEEVDTLLATPAGLPRWAMEPLPLAQAEAQSALDQLALTIAWRKAESNKRGIQLRLDSLRQRFQLSPLEVDALLIATAPEFDLRYERLFGYLQDDVTKRHPSVDLVLNLLSPTFAAKLAARHYFTPGATLLKYHLLALWDEPSQPHPPLLGRYLRVEERVVSFLLGADALDERLLPYARCYQPTTTLAALLLPVDVKACLLRFIRHGQAQEQPWLLYFQGPYGVGKQATAAALAHELGMGLLVVDGEKIGAADLASDTAVDLLLREARLQHALLYWQGFDHLLADDRRPQRDLLLQAVAHQPGLTILAGDVAWEPTAAAQALPFVRIEFAKPTYEERKQLWPFSLNGDMPSDATVDLGTLAAKFRFTAGQIQDAATTARNLARWRDPEEAQVTMADLYTASRLHSNRKLGELARKITPHYTWEEIVLPADRMQQLREIVNQVKYRAKVYEAWGFDHKLAMGKGLNVLFAGPSGTGKTMAADIMAGELGLDLYKIDLSSVVSKYIGETEKNLARIFTEAETSNAILFFDEADALFGKRSEVRDSHDRYANIEISYLLQRMEEYDGMAILATNLHKNLDEAFVRRMHFTVEFPLPNEKNRRRIWEQIWPATTPCSPTLDLDFMARHFELAGGNIRNVALAAAFLAADDGNLVEMRHLIRAIQREYQKMGKVVVDGEFGSYSHFVQRTA